LTEGAGVHISGQDLGVSVQHTVSVATRGF
jgi:hypothetical protein